MRIAIGQISSESNHFVAYQADVKFFRDTGYLYEADDVLRLAGSDTEIGGAIESLRAHDDVEIVPLLATRANSSGPLTRDCWRELRSRMLDRLRAAGPIDGVFLSHHGSMCSVDEPDCEGAMSADVRRIVGPDVPIAMTLDLHGNVTRRMVETTDLIVGYEHYPHDDAFTTGTRAATLLLRTIRGEIRPTMAAAKLPMLLTAFNATTSGDGPFARLMRRAKAIEGRDGVLSISQSFIGSYIDIPEIGCASVVITDRNREEAAAIAKELANDFWEARHQFETEVISVAQAVRRADQLPPGPILLLDTADTTGGGACGDSIGVVRGLIDAGVTAPSLAMVVDPAAAQACTAAGVGASVSLELGHHVDPRWGRPLAVSGSVQRLTDGGFQYKGGIFGGTKTSMGPSAVLRVGTIDILVCSRPTYDWGREQYESMGMSCERARFIAVKNMMNFRSGYRDIMHGYFVVDLPGPTPADMRKLSFKQIPRPMYPFDAFDCLPRIEIHTNRAATEKETVA